MNLTPQVKQGKMWYYNEPDSTSKIGSNVVLNVTPQVKQGQNVTPQVLKCGITMSLTPQVKQGKMWYYNEPDSTSKIG